MAMSKTRRHNRRPKGNTPEALAARLPKELRSFGSYEDPDDLRSHWTAVADWLNHAAPSRGDQLVVPAIPVGWPESSRLVSPSTSYPTPTVNVALRRPESRKEHMDLKIPYCPYRSGRGDAWPRPAAPKEHRAKRIWAQAPSPPRERDAGNCRRHPIPAMLVNRFTLTEYGVVMFSRRSVVQLNVSGPLAFILRAATGAALIAAATAAAPSSVAMCFSPIRIIVGPFLEQAGLRPRSAGYRRRIAVRIESERRRGRDDLNIAACSDAIADWPLAHGRGLSR
jgi:hypothetical protein